MISSIVKLIRPYQWVKNIFLFAPLFFSFSFDIENITNVAIGFMIFCLISSSIYVLNDYHDIEEDRYHPTKKDRPFASGEVSKKYGVFIIISLIILAFSLSLFLKMPLGFLSTVCIYLFINLLYTFWLKHISILDISIIAVGFVLRIYAGAFIIGVYPSMWIVLVTFLLALFLALAKRRDEYLLLLDGKRTRKNIDGYNLEMLNASMTLMAAVTVISYIMYTVSSDVILRLRTDNLYITSMFVIIGILRYIQITFVEKNSGSPSKVALQDRFLHLVIVGWILSFYLIVKVF